MSAVDKALLDIIDRQFECLRPRPRSNAQASFEALPPHLKRLNVANWLRRQEDSEGFVLDQIMELDTDRLVDLLELGDEAKIGELVVRELLKYGERMMEDPEFDK
jgi:hypothetical protein